MTALDLAPIKARADAATEGPWERRDGEDYAMVDAPERPQIALVASGEDATFIAHARTDVPALCDEIERLRAVFEQVEVASLPEKAELVLYRHASRLRVPAEEFLIALEDILTAIQELPNVSHA